MLVFRKIFVNVLNEWSLSKVTKFYTVSFRYDSDNPRVHGDVGMAGVAVDSVEDMKVLLVW